MKKEAPLLMDKATLNALNKIVPKIKSKKQFGDRLYESYGVLHYKDLGKDEALEFLEFLDRTAYLETLEKIEEDNLKQEEALIEIEICRIVSKNPEKYVLILKNKGFYILSNTVNLNLYFRNDKGFFTVSERHIEKTLPILIILQYGDYPEPPIVTDGKKANWPVIKLTSWKNILNKLERVTLPND